MDNILVLGIELLQDRISDGCNIKKNENQLWVLCNVDDDEIIAEETLVELIIAIGELDG